MAFPLWHIPRICKDRAHLKPTCWAAQWKSGWKKNSFFCFYFTWNIFWNSSIERQSYIWLAWAEQGLSWSHCSCNQLKDNFWSIYNKTLLLVSSSRTCLIRVRSTEEVGTVTVCLMVTMSISQKHRNAKWFGSWDSCTVPFSPASGRVLHGSVQTLASLAEQKCLKEALTQLPCGCAFQSFLLPVIRMHLPWYLLLLTASPSFPQVSLIGEAGSHSWP